MKIWYKTNKIVYQEIDSLLYRLLRISCSKCIPCTAMLS